MDKLEKYRQIVVDLLTYYDSLPSFPAKVAGEMEEQLILDRDRDHYQILTIGWEGPKRVYYPIFHVDIKNDKVWVQEDATDFDIVGAMEERGIPKSDIVLAFHAPYRRPHTDYAVG